ncbi:pyridine nucleotide-disulfide oxidoreductase dimerization region [Reticulomyxa filosa]|uniref:Pyridine nucleotide-disulfide oxidoreductase dimerization region n=1 Tax=Reticulomyxa filosa TaxID=46433 RepID=X6MFC3_RETFI|nr:pyridine nucleotide-disulfide oxidoreductase dimerization region [Reticulomyxa filosa]|eukprot:ETO12346.1 pyridine nucleotide-disulfide oxidoreductase dimerization region [Reticulomyxa filosa]
MLANLHVENSYQKIRYNVLEFARVLIATGGQQSVPPITGADTIEYLTNYSLWNLMELPAKIAVIGSGLIDCEIVQAFALIVWCPFYAWDVVYIDPIKGKAVGIKIVVERAKEKKVEELIIDEPNVENMLLKKAGVKFDVYRRIEVNDYLQTSNINVYAIGDCCTRYKFLTWDAMVRMAIRNTIRIDYDVIKVYLGIECIQLLYIANANNSKKFKKRK